MIAISDSRISLAKAARLVGVNVATVWRWAMTGSRGVKLETIVVGGRRQTTVDAIEEFVRQTTAAANGEPAPVNTSKARQRQIADAEARCRAAGI